MSERKKLLDRMRDFFADMERDVIEAFGEIFTEHCSWDPEECCLEPLTNIIETEEENLQIGKLGNFPFHKGFYVYIGSALGKTATNLKHRLRRHLSSTKKLHWHIDFFLDNANVEIIRILYAYTTEQKECQLASAISQIENAKILIQNFGSSDCKENCGSHLFYFTMDKEELLKSVKYVFSSVNLSPNLYES